MKLKNLVIVVALLAALSAAVFLLRRPAKPAAADARVGRSLTAGFALDSAAKLKIADQGKSVLLARPADGGWRVSNYYDLPADFAKLSALISNLTAAKLQRLVTASPERIARLGFNDTKLTFLDSADKELWSVDLGRTAETGGGRYVRFGGESKAYLADFSGWLDPEAKNWADSLLLNLKPEEIAAVEMTVAGEETKSVKRATKDGPWTSEQTPSGQQVSTAKIATVLGAVASIRFSDTTEPGSAAAVAAKAHERIFKLTTFDGRHYRVALGRTPEQKKPKLPTAATSPISTPVPAVAAAPVPAVPGVTPAADEASTASPKPAEPEYETTPAGPVFVAVRSDDPKAVVNALMEKRAFQMLDYTFSSLPQKTAELFEPAAAVPSPGEAAPAAPVPNLQPDSTPEVPKTR